MNSKIKKLIFITIFFLSSCGPYWYKPYGIVFKDMPRGGTPGFNLGWRHGCESGLATQFGGAITMSFYEWRKDPDIVRVNPNLDVIRKRYKKELNIDWNNPTVVNKNISDYKTIFSIARAHCKYAIYGSLQLAGIEPNLPGEERFVPGKHNLHNIYTVDDKGDTRWSFW